MIPLGAVCDSYEMLWALLARYVRPYRGLLAVVALLQVVSTLASLYLPTINAAIIDALRARDANAARAAMRAHLSAVMDHLLFRTEELAVEEVRRSLASTRQRYGVSPVA